MHLHGHSFQLSNNGARKDTVIVRSKETVTRWAPRRLGAFGRNSAPLDTPRGIMRQRSTKRGITS